MGKGKVSRVVCRCNNALSCYFRRMKLVDAQVIAIDGPVAAGKTIVGRELARRLGFRYLDTGHNVPGPYLVSPEPGRADGG